MPLRRRQWRSGGSGRGVELVGDMTLGPNVTRLPTSTEALYLARHHSQRTMTTETPFGYGLGQRARAQVAMIWREPEPTLAFVRGPI